MAADPQNTQEHVLVGHPEVDEDHRALFVRLAAIRESMEKGFSREKTLELIYVLQRYTLRHFAREEVYMDLVHCPSREQNIAEHREFTAKVANWFSLITVGETPLSVIKDIQAESEDWIRKHIERTDCGLRGCPVHKRGQPA